MNKLAIVLAIAIGFTVQGFSGSPTHAAIVTSGTGGQISIGVPSVVSPDVIVPMNTTTSTDPYIGFSIDLRWDKTMFTFDGFDSSASVLNSASTTFCVAAALSTGEVVSCSLIGSAQTSALGKLVDYKLRPVGSPACTNLHIITLNGVDAGDTNSGSYTINTQAGPQANTYGPDRTVDQSSGTGCTPPSSGTPTSTPPLPTNTPTPTATPAVSTATPTPCVPQVNCPPDQGSPFSVELSADPDELVCDHGATSRIGVHVRTRTGADVDDGTLVYFSTFGKAAFVDPKVATTFQGGAAANVGGPFSPPSPFFVRVDVGGVETSIRVLCLPPCSGSAPSCPPPCPLTSPQEAIPPCPPRCFSSSPQSPRCVTPTSTPVPCSTASPPCVPPSPPSCSSVQSSPSPPCGTPVPRRCPDVTGDNRVTVSDLIAIARHLGDNQPNSTYDVNQDGRVDIVDLWMAFSQLRRKCRRETN